MKHIRSGPSNSNKRIGLLGGSFNPAHQGHRAMSMYALKRLNLHEIWWLVSPQNPLKSSQDMAKYATRVKLAQLAAQHPRIIVTTIERDVGLKYTSDLLKLLRCRFSRTRFIWLMGADNLKQVPHWHKWKDLFSYVPVAVFRRPSYAAGRKRGKAALCYDKAWRLSRRGKNFAFTKPPVWLVLDNPLNVISATKIREDQRSGKNKK